jgi:hypothetical protein
MEAPAPPLQSSGGSSSGSRHPCATAAHPDAGGVRKRDANPTGAPVAGVLNNDWMETIMIKHLAILSSAVVATAALSGCIVAAPPPAYGVAYAPPPGVVYVAPTYAAPGPGWEWRYHATYGWGWWHPQRGWHRGWR